MEPNPRWALGSGVTTGVTGKDPDASVDTAEWKVRTDDAFVMVLTGADRAVEEAPCVAPEVELDGDVDALPGWTNGAEPGCLVVGNLTGGDETGERPFGACWRVVNGDAGEWLDPVPVWPGGWGLFVTAVETGDDAALALMDSQTRWNTAVCSAAASARAWPSPSCAAVGASAS